MAGWLEWNTSGLKVWRKRGFGELKAVTVSEKGSSASGWYVSKLSFVNV